MASTPWARRDRGIVLRTVSDQPRLWDAILPSELLVLPAELARVMRCWMIRVRPGGWLFACSSACANPPLAGQRSLFKLFLVDLLQLKGFAYLHADVVPDQLSAVNQTEAH